MELDDTWVERRLRVSRKPGLPAYVQIAENLKDAIEAGELEAGAKLPSLDRLTELAGLARTTLNQALALLKDQGYINSRRGSGYFVATSAERLADAPAALLEDLRSPKLGSSVDYVGPAGPIAELLELALERFGPMLVSPATVRVLVTDADEESLARLKPARLPGLDLHIKPIKGDSPVGAMTPFLRLSDGQVFMSLGQNGAFTDPKLVLHFQLIPAEYDALRSWFDAQWIKFDVYYRDVTVDAAGMFEELQEKPPLRRHDRPSG